MRITNGIMINNNLSNINKNKIRLDNIMTQIETTKKIQRPSEDPIIAIRAMRLRSTYNEIQQYKDRNVEDAEAWMKTTSGAMEKINDALEDITYYCNQGVNTYETVEEYETIIANLKQFRKEVYATGNTDYGDRTIFTGYKTDNTLSFIKDEPDVSYRITQKFSNEDEDLVERVIGVQPDDIDDNETMTGNEVVNKTYHILKLAYDVLDDAAVDIVDVTNDPPVNLAINIAHRSYGADGQRVYENIPANGAVFIPETGELVFGDTAYAQMADRKFEVNYSKTGFGVEELKPENYFTCTKTETVDGKVKTTNYTEKDQKIDYVVSFNQKITVNVQGKDILKHDISRDVDELIGRTQDIVDAMSKIDKIEAKLKITTNDADIAALESLKSAAELELSYARENLKNRFADGIKNFKGHQQTVSVAAADLGARMSRLDMIKDRLHQQSLTVEELKSKNEDTNLSTAAVEWNAMDDVYSASLSAAVKIVQKSLLDFI